MTNRQLSAFVREGFLEWKHEPSESCTIHSTYWYKENEQDDEAKEHITKYKDENGNDVVKVQKIVCRLPIIGLDWHEPSYYDKFFLQKIPVSSDLIKINKSVSDLRGLVFYGQNSN